MKRGMPERVARNRAIYQQWLREQDTKSQETMAKEWGISRARLTQIVLRERERANKPQPAAASKEG